MFDNVITLCCIQADQLTEEQIAGEHLRYVDYIFSLNNCK